MLKWIAFFCICAALCGTAIPGVCQAINSFDSKSVCLLASYKGKYALSFTSSPAICVDQEGYFISCIRASGKDNFNRIVLHPGSPEEQILNADVIRIDYSTGLALYKTTSKPVNAPVTDVSYASEMRVRDKITFYVLDKDDKKPIFFPAIEQLAAITAVDHVKVPKLTNDVDTLVASYDVNNRPKETTDSVPVVNEAGQLTGIYNGKGEIIRKEGVAIGIATAQIYPISTIRKNLLSPVIDLDMSELTEGNMYTALNYPVNIKFFTAVPENLTLELTLSATPAYERTFVAKRIAPASFLVTAMLLDKESKFLLIKRSDSSAEAIYTNDKIIKTDRAPHLLSEYTGILWDEKQNKYFCVDSSKYYSNEYSKSCTTITGLDNIVGSVNGIVGHFDLSKSPQLIISKTPGRVDSYTAHAVLYSAGKQLSEVTQQHSISKSFLPQVVTDSPYNSLPNRLADFPLSVLNDRFDINLPAPVTDVVQAGNGRYLVMRAPTLRAFLVYDVVDKTFQTISYSSDDDCFTTTTDGIIWVDNVAHMVYYNGFYNSGVYSNSARLDNDEPVLALAVGGNSAGPMMIFQKKGASFYSLYPLAQSKTRNQGKDKFLKTLNYKITEIGANEDMKGKWYAGSNADGKLFFLSQSSDLYPRKMIYKYTGNEWQRLTRYYDGRGYSLTGSELSYTSAEIGDDEVAAGKWVDNNSIRYMDIKHPAYYIALDRRPWYRDAPGQGGQYVRIAILTNNPKQVVTELPPFPELGDINRKVSSDTGVKLHIFMCFDNNLIITMPESLDKLILRRFNMSEVLRSSKVDYLFTTTAPDISYTPDKAYSNRIGVESKRGGVKFQLDAGPAGMEVSAAGLISWRPSATQKGEVVVIVSITDNSGQRIFQSYRLQQVVPLL